MPDFRPHTIETAPEASRPLLRGLQEQAGFLPNLAATMAESPLLLEAFLTLRSTAARSSIDAASRELVAIAVAAEMGCTYCVAAHCTFGLKSGATPEAVEAVRAGTVPADPRQQALVRFARSVIRHEGDVQQRGRDLVQAGFTPVQVLEALVAIAVPVLAGAAFLLTGTSLDAVFQPQAWEPTLAR